MIHPTAVVHPSANIAQGVEIGAFSIIGEQVTIDTETIVGPHVVINGHTQIGKNNRFYQFSSIGEANQDMKYQGEPTQTVIGDHNTVREYVTIHRGTVQDKGLTRIGNNNLLMAYSHIAHDCQLGNHIVIANSSNIGGHVVIDDWAVLGGFSGVHQFCRIGTHAFLGIRSHITQDIIPFVLYAEGSTRSINVEGLNRRNFPCSDIQSLKKAYKLIFRKGLALEKAMEQIALLAENCSLINQWVDFIQSSARGIAR